LINRSSCSISLLLLLSAACSVFLPMKLMQSIIRCLSGVLGWRMNNCTPVEPFKEPPAFMCGISVRCWCCLDGRVKSHSRHHKSPPQLEPPDSLPSPRCQHFRSTQMPWLVRWVASVVDDHLETLDVLNGHIAKTLLP
jgi:hypothetical protein